MDATGPNAEQIRYWNETAGPTWVTLEPVIEAAVAPFGRRAMERAAIAAGERVLDVGCGCGGSTLELGRRVGTAGAVLGIDVSVPMLERARRRAAEAGMRHLRFEHADAQVHRFPRGAFDLVFSRFGVMFFVDPAAAFANLRAALRPAGRLAFVCWQRLAENPWLRVPLEATARHIPLPPPPAPGAPGPFSLADAGSVRDLLDRAGFADAACEPLLDAVTLGGGAGLDGAVDHLLHVGPVAGALREAGSDARPAVARAIRDAVAPFATSDGVRMPGAAWIVTARHGG
jgi:SAM-dependent methyltransferase